jgi:putative membrane protein
MARKTVLLGLGAALFGFVSLAQAKEAAGARFIKQAIEGNLAEVQMGQLAQANAQSQDVKTFGQTLQQDHSAANQKAIAVSQQLGVAAPTQPNKKQTADYNKMAKLSGDKFDKAFAQHMVMDHKKDIAAYTKEARQKDPAAGYASETLPTLQKHLDTAQSLAKGPPRTQ